MPPEIKTDICALSMNICFFYAKKQKISGFRIYNLLTSHLYRGKTGWKYEKRNKKQLY